VHELVPLAAAYRERPAFGAGAALSVAAYALLW
jgi:hypothetical protein